MEARACGSVRSTVRSGRTRRAASRNTLSSVTAAFSEAVCFTAASAASSAGSASRSRRLTRTRRASAGMSKLIPAVSPAGISASAAPQSTPSASQTAEIRQASPKFAIRAQALPFSAVRE